MKNQILIKAIAILFLAFTGSFAQDPILKKSAVSRSANGVSIDAANFTSVSGYVMDKDGNRYMSGWYKGTNDFDPGAGTLNYTSTNTGGSPGYDLFITKSDKNDNLIWVKVIGTAGDNETVRNMAVDANGNVIITGVFREDMDFDPSLSTFTMSNGTTPSDFKALFMLKLDADGGFMWAKNFQANTTGGLIVTVDDMNVDAQNNILCSGYFYGDIDFDPSAGTATVSAPSNAQNGYFFKLDASGNYIFHKQYGTSYFFNGSTSTIQQEFGRSSAADASGNVYSLWTFRDFTGLTYTVLDKYSATGTLLGFYRTSLLTTTSPTYLKTVLDKLGNVFISANRSVVKINTASMNSTITSATATWTKPIIGYQIGIDNNNNIIKTGNFSSAEDFDPGAAYVTLTPMNSFADALISKMDNDGNFIYAKGLGASGNSNAVIGRQNITSYGDIQVWGNFENSIDVDPSAGTTTLTNTTGFSSPGFWATYSLPCSGSPNSSNVTVSACGSYYWATKATTYTTSGTYTETLTNVAGCDSVITLNLTINPLPSITFTPAAPVLTCTNPTSTTVTASGGNSYAWTGTGGFTASTALATISNLGTYVVTATGTNACTVMASVNLTENKTAPTITVTPTSTILTCASPTQTFTASGGTSYSWTGPSGFTATTASATVSSAGTYIVTVTGANGCTANANVGVTSTIPIVTVSPTTSILTCTNPTRTITASGGASYSWTGPSGYTASTAAATITVPGTYIVTATAANGCTATTNVIITENKTLPPVVVTPSSYVITCTNPTVNVTGSGADSFAWYTAGGGFLSFNATINFNAAGTYNLRATSTANGCTASVNVVITSDQTPPTGSITPSTPIILTCTNPTATLTASGGVSYLWSKTGGGFTATTATATVTTTGAYKVQITGANGCISNVNATSVNESKSPPTININPASAILTCANPSITLTAGGDGFTYTWTGTGGFTASTAAATINTIGTYSVTGTGGNGCTASTSIVVNENKVYPTISVTPNTPILTCANPNTTITASGANTYTWTGTGGFTANTAAATISNIGTYIVTATAANACTASTSVVITENKTVPTVSVTPTTANITCINSTTTLTANGGNTYSWTGPSGFTSTSATPTVSVGGTYIVTAIGSNGCTATTNAVITENKVLPTISGIPTSAILNCANPNRTLTASGGDSYAWTGTGGFTASTASVTISNIGTYVVTATNTNACTASVSVVITQSIAPPTVTVSPTTFTLTCANPTTTLTASGGSSYAWTGPSGFTATSATPTVSIGGTFIVTATDSNGCTATASATIIDNKVLVVTLGPHNPVINCNFPARPITASGGSSYSWIGPGGFTASTPGVSVTVPGTYTVTASNGNGCTGSTSVVFTEDKTPPITTITASRTLLTCTNPSATLTANTTFNYYYYWDAPQGYAFSQQSINTTLAGAGTYTLYTVGANGCGGSASVVITQNTTPPPISITPTSSAITCTNPTTTLTASGGNTYAWTSTNTFTSTMASVSVSMFGTYTVTATGTNGCVGNATVSVTNNTSVPGATISPLNAILTCINPTTTLTAGGGNSYTWTGPNGFTASTTAITASSGGTYTITSFGINGCTATASVNVTNNKTTPTVTIIPTSPTDAIMTCNLPRVLMEANATGAANPVTYNWVGPNGFVRTGSFPTPVPQSAGIYTVTATDNGGCTATASITVTDGRTPPTLNVTPTSAVLTCTNPTATLTASGASTYEWTKTTGGFNSSLASITVSTTGTYRVVATGVNGCTAAVNVVITEDKTPPTVNIGTPSTNLDCSYLSTTLTGFGADSYSWSGVGGFTATTNAISVSVIGTYFVIGTNTANGCTAARNIVITENKTPIPITVTPTSSILTCANPSATITVSGSSFYAWTGTGGFTATTSSVTISTAGTYIVTATGSNGCTIASSVVITGNTTPPTVSITPETSVLDCINTSIVLTASGGGTYTWTGTGGFASNTASATINSAGTYTVTVIGSNGCTASMSRTITENTTPPTIVITPTSTVLNCTNPSLNMTASGGATYKWYFSGILISSSATINVSSPATYLVTTTGANGCTNFRNVVVTENIVPPTITVNPTSAVLTCANPSTTIIASGGSTYAWTGTGGFTATSASVTISSAGTYIITGTGVNGCTASASVMVTNNIDTAPSTPTISPTGTVSLCLPSTSLTLTASGCTGGTITWNTSPTASTGTSITVTQAGSFSATCTTTCGISPSSATTVVSTACSCLLNTSLATGSWSATNNWSCGHIPLATEPVQISTGHTITLDVNGTAKSLDLRGILNQPATKILTIQGN